MATRLGIIGAGIAGAWIANRLSRAGHDVVVFEKSRGFGGRMATRRSGELALDHGAQFFTARTTEFQSLTKACPEEIAEWQPKVVTLGNVEKPFKREWFEPHFVCTPAMGALCRRLLVDINVALNTEVSELQPKSDGWLLIDNDGQQYECDWVISTAPAGQTQNLIPSAPLDNVTYAPCFALMAGLNARPTFDAAVVRGFALEWLAISSSRPARPDLPGIVAHAGPGWSEEHFDVDKDQVSKLLVEELHELGVAVKPDVLTHRWRYARVVTPHTEPYWLDAEDRLAACRDWGIGPRVEDAFSSANQLLGKILSHLT